MLDSIRRIGRDPKLAEAVAGVALDLELDTHRRDLRRLNQSLAREAV